MDGRPVPIRGWKAVAAMRGARCDERHDQRQQDKSEDRQPVEERLGKSDAMGREILSGAAEIDHGARA